MIKIAICDDELIYRDSIIDALIKIEIKLNQEFSKTVFSSGKDLCQSLKTNSYDIILLDIVMDKLDGIQTAKKIRAANQDSYIIFISSYDEKLRELFGLNVLGFIDKPVQTQKLMDKINIAIQTILKDEKNLFFYTKNGETHFVQLKNILYFEAQGHYLKIKTLEEEIVYKETISNVYKKTNHLENFCMPTRSFIINFKYATISKTKIKIDNCNLEIPISRKKKDEITLKFMKYIEFKAGV